MNVTSVAAYALLESFAKLEFLLKRVPAFIRGKPGDAAMVNWGVVSTELARLPSDEFMEAIDRDTLTQFLNEPRNRPMKQLVELADDGSIRALFKPCDLPPNDAAALLEGAKRVRNNLFHGGKEDPTEERYSGEDEHWVAAATEVVRRLIVVAENGMLRGP